MPPASRKKQLKAAREEKKRRHDEDPAFVPPPTAPATGNQEIGADVVVEEPGAASARQAVAYRQRRSRERLRGVGQQAEAMAGWLRQSSANSFETHAACVRLMQHAACVKMLSVQLDFASECSALQHVVEQRVDLGMRMGKQVTATRHLCLFLPKFHCELNWVERLWGASKDFCRKNCLYTLAGLREIVPLSLSQDLSDVPEHLAHRQDLPVAPILLQRRWARISRQYMAAYRSGADGCEAIRAVKAQRTKRHRDVNNPRARRAEAAMDALTGTSRSSYVGGGGNT